jgi:hypothetical protein
MAGSESNGAKKVKYCLYVVAVCLYKQYIIAWEHVEALYHLAFIYVDTG